MSIADDRRPTFYQYPMGSVGFGAWRELAAYTRLILATGYPGRVPPVGRKHRQGAVAAAWERSCCRGTGPQQVRGG